MEVLFVSIQAFDNGFTTGQYKIQNHIPRLINNFLP